MLLKDYALLVLSSEYTRTKIYDVSKKITDSKLRGKRIVKLMHTLPSLAVKIPNRGTHRVN